MNFIPHLIPVNRGINSTLVMNPTPACSMEAVAKTFEEAYGKEQFVRILPPGKLPDTKHVTLTNVCEFGYVLDTHADKLLVFSCIDNLTKGAAGQAVQCMNIRFGLTESLGLL